MAPFWEKPFLSEEESLKLIHKNLVWDKESLESKYSSPSIYISGLCAYSYTKESYVKEARKLQSYGFECMRSRRESDGKYWETWYLPLFCARGELARRLNGKKDDKEKLDTAVEFLRYEVIFGSLSVSVQALAMSAPD